MTPLPTTIQHFTHQHPIILQDDSINPNYLCEGCMTYGFGTRYHCQSCTFNLHEYCATCPQILSSFMHPHHRLRLVQRDHLAGDRVCNICRDPIEGLSYRCALCEFDVHPICTQLAETLNHILHQQHPLRLLGSTEPGTCAVCRGACNTSLWRYRCALCTFDIHIDCVSVPCQNRMSHRGIPTYVPPSIFPQQHYFDGCNPRPNHFPGPSYNMHHHNYNMPQLCQQHQGQGQAQTHYGGYNPRPNHFPGPSYNMHHHNYNMPQLYQQHQGGYNPRPNHFPGPSYNMYHYNYNMPQLYQQHQGQGQAQTHYGGRIGQVMFSLVKSIMTGVISNMVFGVDVSQIF